MRSEQMSVQGVFKQAAIVQVLTGLDIPLIPLRSQIMGQMQVGQVDRVELVGSAQGSNVVGNSRYQTVTVFLGGELLIITVEIKAQVALAFLYTNSLNFQPRNSQARYLRRTGFRQPTISTANHFIALNTANAVLIVGLAKLPALNQVVQKTKQGRQQMTAILGLLGVRPDAALLIDDPELTFRTLMLPEHLYAAGLGGVTHCSENRLILQGVTVRHHRKVVFLRL